MSKTSRRQFSKLLAGTSVSVGGLYGKQASAQGLGDDPIVVPPTNAIRKTTACNYCIVGCGYRTFAWPVGQSGELVKEGNALARDYSPKSFMGEYPWPSPQMHNIVQIDGKPHHLIVQPDPDATVVNPGGDHTLGGSLARKLYSEETGTGFDRFLNPKLRVDDELVDITWDEALSLVARLTAHVLGRFGRLAWGIKSYSYQFYENTYAITKLALGAIGTPCWAPHDQPGDGSSTPGLSDAGINAFSATYDEWSKADVIFMSGVSAYDTKGVLFSNWVSPQRGDRRSTEDIFDFQDTEWISSREAATLATSRSRRLIVVDPIKTRTAEVAERYGGLHLQINPGTDSVLLNALTRIILEEGWEDSDFISEHVGGAAELAQESSWRRIHHAVTFEDFRSFIFADDIYTLSEAERITGIPRADIRKAAELMAQPIAGRRPKTSLMLEKGNYWNHNYVNTAALASLGLLVGAGHRPGQVVSRGGGHQRGMVKGAGYPSSLSAYAEQTTGNQNKIGHNIDDWILQGKLRMAWAIGCTWAGGGTASASQLYGKMLSMSREHSSQLRREDVFPSGIDGGLDVDAAFSALAERIDAVDADGQPTGMVFVQQDIYPQDLTELADIVLAPYSWGEADFSRMQGERRLRLYSKIMDPPGDTRGDWWIIAEVAKRLRNAGLPTKEDDPEQGYDFSGFEWTSESEVFAEAAGRSGGVNGYQALVDVARELGADPHQLLADRGTRGFQCPLSVGSDNTIVETERNFHAAKDGGSRYSTRSGRAFFVRGDWRAAEPNQERWQPRSGELWIVNRRTSDNWSGMIEDARNSFRVQLAGESFIELHPLDAERIGVTEGSDVRVETELKGGNELVSFEAKVCILEAKTIREGVAAAYFNYFGAVRFAANNVTPNDTDPNGMMYPFKLGRGRIVPV